MVVIRPVSSSLVLSVSLRETDFEGSLGRTTAWARSKRQWVLLSTKGAPTNSQPSSIWYWTSWVMASAVATRILYSTKGSVKVVS